MIFQPVSEYKDAKDVASFIKESVDRIKETVGDERIYIPVSGGVDSSSVAAMIRDAVGDSMIAEHYDHGGMRKWEPRKVVDELSNSFPVTLLDKREYFMKSVIDAGEDPEAKRRKGVSDPYFMTMFSRATSEGCKYVADGTIAPDLSETLDTKLKWQHNIASDEKKALFEKSKLQFIHPLYYVAKPMSRAIANYYGLPTKRRPFPGPGLYIRAIGQVTPEKMRIVREADSIATPLLEKFVETDENKLDKQYFVAIADSWRRNVSIDQRGLRMENPMIYRAQGTGMSNYQRTYGHLLVFDSDNEIPILIQKANEVVRVNREKNIGRIAVNLAEEKRGNYIALLRAIETKDFTRAMVVPVVRNELESVAFSLMTAIPELNQVAFDVQDKPDSTIEYE
ncbi:MAG: hypothetical protein V1944_02105 [Candidatus Aenigmatarchaeota archaeon]